MQIYMMMCIYTHAHRDRHDDDRRASECLLLLLLSQAVGFQLLCVHVFRRGDSHRGPQSDDDLSTCVCDVCAHDEVTPAVSLFFSLSLSLSLCVCVCAHMHTSATNEHTHTHTTYRQYEENSSSIFHFRFTERRLRHLVFRVHSHSNPENEAYTPRRNWRDIPRQK